MHAGRPIEQRITAAERRLSRATRTDALRGLVGNGDALRTGPATRHRHCPAEGV